MYDKPEPYEPSDKEIKEAILTMAESSDLAIALNGAEIDIDLAESLAAIYLWTHMLSRRKEKPPTMIQNALRYIVRFVEDDDAVNEAAIADIMEYRQ